MTPHPILCLQVQNHRKSYSTSSSQNPRDGPRDRDLELRLNNVLDTERNAHASNKHGGHGHGGHKQRMFTGKQSMNTSSTKLNQSLSPRGSWRSRNNFLVARAHENTYNYTYSPVTNSKEELLARKRDARLLNQIDEERTGNQRDASSGSSYQGNHHAHAHARKKQTSSYPTLLFTKPTIHHEKIDKRCTSV